MWRDSCTSAKDLEELSNFTRKAAPHKTPKKLDKAPINVGKHNTIATSKSLTPEIVGVNPSNAKFLQNISTDFEKVDSQFFKLELIAAMS